MEFLIKHLQSYLGQSFNNKTLLKCLIKNASKRCRSKSHGKRCKAGKRNHRNFYLVLLIFGVIKQQDLFCILCNLKVQMSQAKAKLNHRTKSSKIAIAEPSSLL